MKLPEFIINSTEASPPTHTFFLPWSANLAENNNKNKTTEFLL